MILSALQENRLQDFEDMIEETVVLDDPLLTPHLSRMLGFIKSAEFKNQSLIEVSNIVKQTNPCIREPKRLDQLLNRSLNVEAKEQHECEIRNFSLESEKLEWAGISFSMDIKLLISKALLKIANQSKASELRFWGKVLGTNRDYYVLQGVRDPQKSHSQLSIGQEKGGEGINYYTFWVANDPSEIWTELPILSPEHIKISRQIKCLFSGYLDKPIYVYPSFPGFQRHYLKAQLCRMTHALELAPKGVYKVHDENPKIIEFQEEVKVPEFAELNSLESWTHKNQILLNLGRCSHFVDPSLTEEQIEAATAELAEKDPECERLRAITQDKPPEAMTASLGIESLWTVKVEGDNQVFNKEQAQLVYGVVVLKNIYWPGWVTIGYKGGYSNIYLGRGIKSVQDGWSTYENPNLQEDAEDIDEFGQPNSKDEPKAPQQPKEAEEEADA